MDYAWDQNHEIQRQKNLYVLGEGFAALAGKMHESQAAEVIQNLLVELQSMKDYFQSKALTGAMVAVAGQVPEVDARDVTKVILSAIKGTQDSDLLEALGKCLAAVAGKMPQAQASELTKAFVSTIEATQNLSQLEAVGQGFAAVAPRIADDDQAAIILFEAMKNPLIPRDPITAAIRKRFPEAPPKEKGFWTLIEWADKEKHFQGLDLEAPLAQPSNITAGTTPPGIPMANEIKRN